MSPSTSRSVTPITSFEQSYSNEPLLTTPIGEQLHSDYEVHELPSESGSSVQQASQTDVLVNTALLARIEFLEAENRSEEKITNQVNAI